MQPALVLQSALQPQEPAPLAPALQLASAPPEPTLQSTPTLQAKALAP